MAREPDIHRLTATEAIDRIRIGTLSAEQLTHACLDRIEERDPSLKAWTHVSRAGVLDEARALDKRPAAGRLHGIPVAVKDVIEVQGMPTRYNSAIYQDHVSAMDAACVATLRAAGAVIIGKTDTTEFAAAGRDAATGNPHDLTRTPGGSSSGSAAAVADCHVALALATQTGGSTIRPGSFCGVYAMKPSWSLVSREGAKLYSITLDTIGWYARSVADLALMCDVFGIEDDEPAEPRPSATLKIAICRSPAWSAAEPATVRALGDARAKLAGAGVELVDLDLPEPFERLIECHRIILYREGQAAFWNLYQSDLDRLHDDFKHRVENRDGYSNAMLRDAYDVAASCRAAFDGIAGGFDAVLTPSAPGEAPVGRRPGDPVFNLIWTLLHVPCINIPVTTGPAGLPVGLTVTGPRFTDRKLLAVAGRLAEILS